MAPEPRWLLKAGVWETKWPWQRTAGWAWGHGKWAGYLGLCWGLKEGVMSSASHIQAQSTIREAGTFYVCANSSLLIRLPQGWGTQNQAQRLNLWIDKWLGVWSSQPFQDLVWTVVLWPTQNGAQSVGIGKFERVKMTDYAESSPFQLVPVSTLQIIINYKPQNPVLRPSSENSIYLRLLGIWQTPGEPTVSTAAGSGWNSPQWCTL